MIRCCYNYIQFSDLCWCLHYSSLTVAKVNKAKSLGITNGQIANVSVEVVKVVLPTGRHVYQVWMIQSAKHV